MGKYKGMDQLMIFGRQRNQKNLAVWSIHKGNGVVAGTKRLSLSLKQPKQEQVNRKMEAWYRGEDH